MRRTEERLQDILDSIEAIERYASQGRSTFEDQELVQVWIVHHLQIIGEAANTIPHDLTSLYPQVPWAQIIAFRNIIVHEYFRLSLSLVWAIVVNDLPRLKIQVIQILSEVNGGGD
ncbi:DUF86 domain-containing protein [Limnothrix sp. FACHB-708]|uniref:HepT-like ribonuclease domain-containing protein n=1 Tax=unclassified Limnothrix TaxID=2632864 RepID=UPI001688A76F|nr:MULTISPECIES: DUF86 domain-containing protein [unclassified Limnothrix]MBD2555161.1 DUF86 domain-containing protein [Limnothrix sp. FACHB-708]MBD2592587.1 DUF86 domain-containing protein [Limnothrix sp. FACHB-406]